MRLRINMATNIGFLGISLLMASGLLGAAEKTESFTEHNRLMDHGAGHLMDMDGGMVMGQNKDTLPPGCSRISGDESITVRAGHRYARDYPGTMFGFDQHEWRVKPCSRLTVTFINEDHIRHQWMMHGLPKFIYDKGMFHLEMTGPAKITGTLILPAEDRTYLVHCDIAQHMEKGMKGQLIVGQGSTPFPSIPGISDFVVPDDYGPKVADSVKAPPPAAAATSPAPAVAASGGGAAPSTPEPSANGTLLLGLLLGVLGTPLGIGYYRRHYQGLTREEAIKQAVNSARSILDKTLGFLTTLIGGINKR